MQASPFDLTGKVALITGGNGGIGLAIAKGFAEAGASVAIADRNADNASDAMATLAKACGANNSRAISLIADVTDKAAVAAMVAATLKDFGRIDILVNNAGISLSGPPEDMSLENWQTVIDVNLTAPFVCAQAVHPAMKRQGGGKIINIASVLANLATGNAPNYAASKGGVLQLTRSLAVAWAPDNIQVNAILPGWIDTDMTKRARDIRPELHDRIMARVPAARWGTPDDLAGAAVFLASRASDFVTGAAHTVDGGFTAMG